MRKRALAAAVLAGMATQASAFQVDTGNSDLEVRWDNTLKYNLVTRVEGQDSDVNERAGAAFHTRSNPSDSFDKGDIVSNRFDLLSELDVVWKDTVGFRISAAGWYDHAYHNGTDHDENGVQQNFWDTALTTVPGELNDKAERFHYQGGEILDAFVFWNWELGDVAGNVRAGKHVIYWGQSLLATAALNTAGASMNPVDFNKGLSVPGSEAKELFRPTEKVSTVIQLSDQLTFSAFYSFGSEPYRLPQASTYLSPSSLLNDATEVAWLAPGLGLQLLNNEIEDDGGEWGVNFSYYFEDSGMEVSAYYINYTDKTVNGLTAALTGTGTLALSGSTALAGAQAGLNGVDPAVIAAATGAYGGPADLGTYAFISGDLMPLADGSNAIRAGYAKWIYKEDIDLFGLSFSKQVGDVSVGLDITHHRDKPLRLEGSGVFARSINELLAGGSYSIPEFNNAGTDPSDYPHVTGDTWAVAINALGLLTDNGIWEGGSYIVEATFTMIEEIHDDQPGYLLVVDENGSGLQSLHENRVTSHIAAVFRPTWYQVMPGVDLTVPMSISYQIDGDGPAASHGDNEFGSASVGLDFSVNQKWSASLRYNSFFGPVNNTVSQLKDRDNVSLSFKRTF